MDNNQYTDYLLENFNIKVVVDWTAASGNDYTQKVALCIASNTLPDAMTVSREYMLKAAKAGQLYDLTDLFQKVQSDQVKEVMDSTDGQAIAEASVDGRQYAIPAVEVETGSVQVLNVRQDWLDEYGLDAPKTLDDVENIAKVFAEKNRQAKIPFRWLVQIKIQNAIPVSWIPAQQQADLTQYLPQTAHIRDCS